MTGPNCASSGAQVSADRWTTVIASAWGFVSAFVLFNSLLVTHKSRSCFAAAIALSIVWATLDRKRWGRLALLGMSVITVAVFAELVVSTGPSALALKLFRGTPILPYVVLCLAVASTLWLRRPEVIVEFERGKRSSLAGSQSAIALTLVACWAFSIIKAPPLRSWSRPVSVGVASVSRTSQTYTIVTSRIARSAAAANSR